MSKKSKLLTSTLESRVRCLELQVATLSGQFDAWIAMGLSSSSGRKAVAALISDRLSLVASVAGEVGEVLGEFLSAHEPLPDLQGTLDELAALTKRVSTINCVDHSRAVTALVDARFSALCCARITSKKRGA